MSTERRPATPPAPVRSAVATTRRWGLARILPLLALLLVGTPQARGGELTPEQRRQVLAEAVAAFDHGIEIVRRQPEAAKAAFRDAADRFQLLVDDGVANGRLYYNLANAQLRAGALGPSILNYRRAQRLMPGDPQVSSNLAYARSLCPLRIAPSGRRALADSLLGWHRRTSLRGRATVFAVSYTAFWILLSWRAFRRSGVAVAGSAIAALLFVASGLSVAADTVVDGAPRIGVIVTDDVVVRKGDGEGFEPQLERPLPEGVEFELRDRRGEWLFIELVDNTTGWIRADEAAVG